MHLGFEAVSPLRTVLAPAPGKKASGSGGAKAEQDRPDQSHPEQQGRGHRGDNEIKNVFHDGTKGINAALGGAFLTRNIAARQAG